MLAQFLCLCVQFDWKWYLSAQLRLKLSNHMMRYVASTMKPVAHTTKLWQKYGETNPTTTNNNHNNNSSTTTTTITYFSVSARAGPNFKLPCPWVALRCTGASCPRIVKAGVYNQNKKKLRTCYHRGCRVQDATPAPNSLYPPPTSTYSFAHASSSDSYRTLPPPPLQHSLIP